MWHGTSDSAVRRLSVPCSGRKRQSQLNWCASSASEGCSEPDPAGEVSLPTCDWPIPTSTGKHSTRPGYRKRSRYQIWWQLIHLDRFLADNHDFAPWIASRSFRSGKAWPCASSPRFGLRSLSGCWVIRVTLRTTMIESVRSWLVEG